jgi:hypothetical protein
MRNMTEKAVQNIQNTLFIFSRGFSSENPTDYEIMRKNIVQPGRPQMTI